MIRNSRTSITHSFLPKLDEEEGTSTANPPEELLDRQSSKKMLKSRSTNLQNPSDNYSHTSSQLSSCDSSNSSSSIGKIARRSTPHHSGSLANSASKGSISRSPSFRDSVGINRKYSQSITPLTNVFLTPTVKSQLDINNIPYYTDDEYVEANNAAMTLTRLKTQHIPTPRPSTLVRTLTARSAEPNPNNGKIHYSSSSIVTAPRSNAATYSRPPGHSEEFVGNISNGSVDHGDISRNTSASSFGITRSGTWKDEVIFGLDQGTSTTRDATPVVASKDIQKNKRKGWRTISRLLPTWLKLINADQKKSRQS
ncbi:hypothetical protein HDU76_006945 [Blyttiomyces sp. JEL0837]|nr:hypothetical protein HDU76_006945 [Blyttiomyces sp. JEL0837]